MGVPAIQILYAQEELKKSTVLLRTELTGIKDKGAILVLWELTPGAWSGPLSIRDRGGLCLRRVCERGGEGKRARHFEGGGHVSHRASRGAQRKSLDATV